MRLLFYKTDLAWPRTSGHDVYAYYMMRAMSQLGARIGLVTRRPPSPQASSGLELEMSVCLGEPAASDNDDASPLSGLEERYRSYWGMHIPHIRTVGLMAERFDADAVVAVGLDGLPMLGAVTRARRVWYAADEWCWHHTSQVNLTDRQSWTNLRAAAIKGLYERAFRRRIDRVWVVSSKDARAMRWVAGVRDVDVVPLGVDFDWFRPSDCPEDQDTAVFWGRLDFGPNLQALDWFCHRVWPSVRRAHPQATFTIVGMNPTPPVGLLERLPGVTLRLNLEDIRSEIARHAVVVLPFISGGGIKNKLLEGAAMGKAIVCSRRALLGLNGDPPLIVAEKNADWTRSLSGLWLDHEHRRQVGRRLRAWVVEEHGWERPARTALESLA